MTVEDAASYPTQGGTPCGVPFEANGLVIGGCLLDEGHGGNHQIVVFALGAGGRTDGIPHDVSHGSPAATPSATRGEVSGSSDNDTSAATQTTPDSAVSGSNRRAES